MHLPTRHPDEQSQAAPADDSPVPFPSTVGDPREPTPGGDAPATRPESSEMPLLPVPPGDPGTVGGRFRVLRAHARGGVGQVSVAHDGELRREVALKEIQDCHAHDPDARARFLLEAEITGRLEHPGVVPVYSLGAHPDGRPFYAMRFVKGQSLQEAITQFHQKDGPARDSGERAVELNKLLRRFLDVCNAVAYAHSKGVLHRDLKPSNVMLGEYGETLVVDWGLAKVTGTKEAEGAGEESLLRPESAEDLDRTRAGAVIGTPQYMPPEQASGRSGELGPASDVYSLGATLYCLLAGRPPFKGGTVGEVLDRVRRGDFPPPRQAKADVPAALEAVVLKAMALRPEDRYPSARALAGDVEHWLADEPTAAYRESRGQRLARWARRHRTTVVALVLLLAAAVGGLWLWRVGEEQSERRLLGLKQAAEADEKLAGVELRANHFASAEKILAQAADRLEKEEALSGLRDRLRQRHDEARQLVQFYRLRDKAEELAILYRDRPAIAAAVRALEELRTFDRPDWWEHLPTRDLTPQQADRLRQDVYRQLFVLAGMRAKTGLHKIGSPEAAPAFAEAMKDLERAKGYRQSFSTEAMEFLCRLGMGQLAQMRFPAGGPKDSIDHYFTGLAHFHVGELPDDPTTRFLLLQVRLMKPNFLDLKEPTKAAERHLREAVRLDRDNYWNHFFLAHILQRAGKFDEAETAYAACVALRPDYHFSHGALADLYSAHGLAAKDPGEKQQCRARALASLARAMDLSPDDPDLYHARAIHQEKWGDLDRALEDYNTALALDPNNFVFLASRADLYESRGETRRALADYDAALRLEPDDALNLSNRATCRYRLHRHDEALADCDAALRLDREQVRALNIRGLIRVDRGQFKEAIADYTRALDVQPKDSDLHSNRAYAYFRLGEHDRAVAECNKAIELSAANDAGYNIRGLALAGKGEHEKALADYDAAIRTAPKRSYYHSNRGLSLLRLGRHKEALESCEQALALDRTNAEALSTRGHAHHDLREYDKAVEAYTGALGLQPNNAGHLIDRGNSKRLQGDLGGALADLDAALKHDEALAGAWNIRGLVHRSRRDFTRAADDFTRALQLQPASAHNLRPRFSVLAELAEWERAEADLIELDRQGALSAQGASYRALLRLRAGDTEGYRKACAALLREARTSPSDETVPWAVSACVAGPAAVDDPATVVELAEKWLAGKPGEADRLALAGAALHRAGRSDAAVAKLNEAVQAGGGEATAWQSLFLATAHQKLGKPDEAKKWLDKALPAVEKQAPEKAGEEVAVPWDKRLSLRLLVAEARAARVWRAPR